MEPGNHRKRKRASRDHEKNGIDAPTKAHHRPDVTSEARHVDTSKPTAVFTATTPRTWTVSVAVPGSIIANAQTHDLKTSLASSIARCAAVFSIDEIIVFDDGTVPSPGKSTSTLANQDARSGYTAFSDPSHFLMHVLSYLETPPYLRKALFPHHPNLRTAGVCASLDMPHHCRVEEGGRWREGVTLAVDGSGKDAMDRDPGDGSVGTYVDIGGAAPVSIDESIPPGVRVTVDFGAFSTSASASASTSASSPRLGPKPAHATAVAPSAPRESSGLYTGYTIRRAPSLSAIFTSPPPEYRPTGYDYSIGTSERGVALPEFLASHQKLHSPSPADREQGKPPFAHLLLAFGGLAGLEAAVGNDAALRERGLGVAQASEVFDAWVDLVPGQGSRTVRTEEAVWLGCMGLRGLWM